MQYSRKVFRPFKGLKLSQAEWRRKFASGEDPLRVDSASSVRRNKWPSPRFHKNLIEFGGNRLLISRAIEFVL